MPLYSSRVFNVTYVASATVRVNEINAPFQTDRGSGAITSVQVAVAAIVAVMCLLALAVMFAVHLNTKEVRQKRRLLSHFWNYPSRRQGTSFYTILDRNIYSDMHETVTENIYFIENH